MQMNASKDKASAEFQRLSWDALRKSINGLINKVCPRFALSHVMLDLARPDREGDGVQAKSARD